MRYDPPPVGGWLRQGEILENIWEHRVLVTTEQVEGIPLPARSVLHPRAIVLTADCDLEWDYKSRVKSGSAGRTAEEHEKVEPRILSIVLLCDLHEESTIRSRGDIKSDIWRRIRGNQDERYHALRGAVIGEEATVELPSLYMDFLRIFAVPTVSLYQGIEHGAVKRIAVVPHTFVHDLMHRCFGFLSRVGIPAAEEQSTTVTGSV